MVTEGAVLQLRHELIEFLARVPLFLSFVVDDCYLHIFVGVLLSARTVQAECNQACLNC